MEVKWIILNGEVSKYIINKHGDIYNTKTWKKLSSTTLNRDGYPIVSLTHKGKHHTIPIHRLVAIYFIPNPNNKKEVHHKDGNNKNFDSSNLMWCTNKEHWALERERVGKFNRSKGEKHGQSKYSDELIKCVINDLLNGMSRQDVCKKYNVVYDTVHRIYNKTGWCHLTEGIEFKKIDNPVRCTYSDELKKNILYLGSQGKGPKTICEELNIEYTPKLRNYIKTLIRRNKNRDKSSTTIETNEKSLRE